MCVCVCVCFSSHLFWTSSSLDVPAGVTQEEGHTGFIIHLSFLVRKIPFAGIELSRPNVSEGYEVTSELPGRLARTYSFFKDKYLKMSEVRMIHKSYGRDSGRCWAFTTAVVQKTMTATAVVQLTNTTTAVVQQTIATAVVYYYY